MSETDNRTFNLCLWLCLRLCIGDPCCEVSDGLIKWSAAHMYAAAWFAIAFCIGNVSYTHGPLVPLCELGESIVNVKERARWSFTFITFAVQSYTSRWTDRCTVSVLPQTSNWESTIQVRSENEFMLLPKCYPVIRLLHSFCCDWWFLVAFNITIRVVVAVCIFNCFAHVHSCHMEYQK